VSWELAFPKVEIIPYDPVQFEGHFKDVDRKGRTEARRNQVLENSAMPGITLPALPPSPNSRFKEAFAPRPN
jgi:hypothetical protein